MPIVTPGKHFSPRLQKSRLFGKGSHGRKGTFADLLITPLVDMFVIIVIFLLQNFSASGDILFMQKDITLPEAKYGAELERAPVVQISPDAILLEGEQIAIIRDIERDEFLNIPLLEERLRDLKRRYEQIHTEAFKGDINIQGHNEVKFKIANRVMYSCSLAGFGNVNMAVLDGVGLLPPAI